MEFNFKNLDMLTLKNLRKICKSLDLKLAGRRKEVITRLTTYLTTAHGRQKAYEKLDRSFLRRIYSDQDPISTLVKSYQPQEEQSSVLATPSLAETLEQGRPELRCVCELGSFPLLTCSTCFTKQHTACMGRNSEMQGYQCPLCLMAALDPSQPPFKVLVMPFALPRENPYYIKRGTQKEFSLDQETYREVAESPETTQIQLRCMMLDGEGFNCYWPSKGAVIINGTTVFEPHKLQAREDLPLVITNKLKQGTNSLSVLKYKDPQYFIAAVFLVKKLPAQSIINRVAQKIKFLPKQEGINFVKKTLLNEGSASVSVKCRFSGKLLKTPVRGIHCTHLECFSFEEWVVSQGRTSSKWRCPVCWKKAVDLVQDLYFEEAVLTCQTANISFHSDGSYSSTPTPKKHTNKTELPKKKLVVDLET